MLFRGLRQLLQKGLIVATVLIIIKVISISCSPSRSDEVAGSIIIVNTIDGSFIGIDVRSGKELWKIPGPPIISQSLSDLRLVTENSDYMLVPSLDGQLYLLERNLSEPNKGASLKALPLTVDSLFSSNFMLTEDSVLTGGRDNSLFAFNPISGKVKYNCSRDGCSRAPPMYDTESSFANRQEAMILVYCVNHIVRAVHVPTGMERWNLSIRQHDLCLINEPLSISSTALQRRLPTCVPSAGKKDPSTNPDKPQAAGPPATNPNDPDLEFGLDQLLIVARTKAPLSHLLWSYQLESRITKAWLYSAESRSLEPLQLFIHDTRAGYLAENLRTDQARLSATVQEVSRKKTLSDLFMTTRNHSPPPVRSPRDPECPSRDRLVYLGHANGSLYIQLEDSADFPSPSRIDLPRLSVEESPDSPPSSTLASNFSPEHEGDTEQPIERFAQSMIGYYRASYAARPTDSMCMQPFLSDHAQSDWSTNLNGGATPDQRALVPWNPKPDPNEQYYAAWAEESDYTEAPTAAPSEAFSAEWVFDNARDLFMLLLRANELSDGAGSHSMHDALPVSRWDKFSHTIHLVLLACVLYLTDRLFRLFHECRDPNFTALVRRSSQTSLVDFNPDTPICGAATSTPTSDHPDQSGDRQTGCEQALGSVGHSSIACGTQSVPPFTSVYETEFKFVRCLGRGAFGRVFEAENRFDGHRYAIKRIQIEQVGEDEHRFFREVRVLASLDHPGIVRYHRAWSEYPPPGWQEARDKAMFSDTGDDGDEDTGADLGGSWDDPDLTAATSTWDATHRSALGDSNLSSLSPAHSPGSASHVISGIRSESPSLRFSLNRHMEDSLIVFQREPTNEATKDQAVEQNGISSDCSASLNVQTGAARQQQHDRTTSMSDSGSRPAVWYLYIQMQLCSQMSLRDWLANNNRACTRPARLELYHMFWQIADAVAYLHAHELMHRDLKPSNILFDSTNRLKLADFGLVTSFADESLSRSAGDSVTGRDAATLSPSSVGVPRSGDGDSGHSELRASDSDVSGSGGAGAVRRHYFGIRAERRHTDDVGTDLYMSPEQEQHQPYDRSVDIFSLGLIFIELLIPFATDMERVCTLLQAKRQVLPDAFTEEHPNESSFIKRLLDPVPSKRPSARDITQDPLLGSTKQDSPTARQPPAPVTVRAVV